MFKRNVFAVSMTLAALCSAQAAFAEVNGGGATLPQPLYQTPGVLTAGFAAYIGVGSGNGKAAFLENKYDKLVPGVTNKNVHWAGSDSKLSLTELSTYASDKQPGWGKLIQVPSVATSVAIAFNKAGAGLNLSVDQLCGVFSGRYSDWSEVVGSGRTGTITVVYRNGNSGTTELFTRFLNAKCNAALEGGTFAVTQDFKSSFSGPVRGTRINPLQQAKPGGGFYADTSEGVMSTLNAADSRITYMSPDYAAATLAGLDDATKVAKIAGVSPAPANVSAAIGVIQPPALINRGQPGAWVPTFAATASTTDPSIVAYPTTGYPILGFTNLIFSQCYADAEQTTQVRNFFARHYGAFGNNDTAITDNRFVPLPGNWKTAVRDTFLTATNELSIGKSNVCNQIGRPL
ncbi:MULTISPECIES: substrate-binding domain-containing protein [Pseudomonas]|uniref:Protein disulfide reductase n=2 Tax=Pseudomonas gessardii TaxID=78544 RepID=A0A7Y1QKX8_9PSED|nr:MULTISPECIES: substrate-binding domain-containing protein [Pseudomonas]MCF4980831.1 protein disulfide reductase [Pseudomonas gessardii]MCF4990230.1 protein disulfide reductase [Pseudomonas gessardii]MCF5097850.1 protein disulfide reductase [Pseudomonas gessardii]MCF5110312.1 protein disulfide reductase [Pseudomonas gessardii]NNA66022.1 PstS family phosphate ABC transporter substrate-binding protein [Pseudomonas gessardii]